MVATFRSTLVDPWPKTVTHESNTAQGKVSRTNERFILALTSPIRLRLRGRHALHRNRQASIRAFGQRDKLTVSANRVEDRVDTRFHHLFRAHGIVTLVLIEVTPQ